MLTWSTDSSALVVSNRKDAMSNIIAFPSKDHRQWAGIAQDLEVFLIHQGARVEQIPEILSRLRERWEQLGAPFSMQLPYSIPAPLSEEQVAAFEVALREQAAYISQKWKEESARTLIEFARLECLLALAS